MNINSDIRAFTLYLGVCGALKVKPDVTPQVTEVINYRPIQSLKEPIDKLVQYIVNSKTLMMMLRH